MYTSLGLRTDAVYYALCSMLCVLCVLFISMNCSCETLYSDLVTSYGLSSHLIIHLFVYYMYNLFIYFLGPWVDSLLCYMGSRDHLFDICLYFGVLRINLLTYLFVGKRINIYIHISWFNIH